MRRRKIAELLARRRRWIEEKLARSRAIAARPPQLGLASTHLISLEGEPIAVEVRVGGRAIAVLINGVLLVGGGRHTAPAAGARWYRREARARLTALTDVEADRLGLAYTSLGVRDPRTRCGSCSSRAHLSFSWRLVVAPPPVMRYVVIHELCALSEPNRGRDFWRLLAAVPDWRDAVPWLKEHGQELHDYEPLAAAPPPAAVAADARSVGAPQTEEHPERV